MKSCSNCRNYIWKYDISSIPDACIKCIYIEGVEGKVPSNWKPHPMTNADRIRSMSDEELAKFLVYFDERRCEHCNYENQCNSKCIGGVREWLRKPAEEVAE